MKLKPLLFILMALLLSTLFASPYIALHEMRSAAAARDAAQLGAYVDFAALRENLKRGAQRKLLGEERNERGEPSPGRAMGAAVAGALLSPMVDALITPESLSRLIQGEGPARAAVGAVVGEGSAPPPKDQLETRTRYEGFNTFVFSVRRQGAEEDPVDLVLERRGVFGWKLADLRIP